MQVFEFVPATETAPPQIRNEHLGTRQQVIDAYAALNEWEIAHDLPPTQVPPEEE